MGVNVVVDVTDVGPHSSEACLSTISRRSHSDFGYHLPRWTNFPQMSRDRHSGDENASATEPAKLLAVFVVHADEKELLSVQKLGPQNRNQRH